MNIVDVLITEYKLHAKNYEEGAKKVVSATQAVGSSVSSILGKISLGVGVIGTAMAAVAGGVLGWAVQQAIEFDTINRSLVAITGSAERAQQVLNFSDKLALPSIFTAQELAGAAKLLEAYGLQTERFLPIAEALGTVFGSTKEALDSYITSLGYLQGQRFGEAFESLARAGISRDALKLKGLKFDKGGEFLGSVSQALTAVEELVKEKFGKLSRSMAEGPQAKMASVMDSIGRSARQAGYVLLSVLMPAAEKVGNFFAYLYDQKIIEKAVSGIVSMFGGIDMGSSLVTALAYVTATFMNLPKLIQGAIDMMGQLANQGAYLASILGAIFLGGAMYRGVMLLISAFVTLKGVLQASAVWALIFQGATQGPGAVKNIVAAVLGALAGYGIYRWAESKMPSAGDLGKMLSGLPGVGDIRKDAQAILDGFQSKGVGASILDTAINMIKGNGGASGLGDPNLQTAQNTAKLVDLQQRQLDLQRSLTGGGQVSEAALSGLNVDRALGGSSTRERMIRSIDDYISESIGKRLVGRRTYGYKR